MVPNGSFETFTNCPTSGSQIYFAPPWTGPACNSTDYFNACSNPTNPTNVPYYAGINNAYPYYLNAKDGNAYVGIHHYTPGYREYLQVKLIDSLKNGYCYFVSFYAANFQAIKYACNNVAAALTQSANSVSPPIPPNPNCPLLNLPLHITNYGNPVLKDTVKWHQISGLYIAGGNEFYLTIGNFKDDSNTDTVNLYPPGTNAYNMIAHNYIFVDAVSVFSINPTGNLPWKYRDTTILLGDSVYIGNTMGGNFNPKWYTIGGSYITTNAGIYVKPAATTSYVVNYTVCGTPRADTVEVKVVTDIKVKENELGRVGFKMFPNPSTHEITIEFESDTDRPKDIIITDLTGRILMKIAIDAKKQNISLGHLSKGCYYLQAKNSSGTAFVGKIIKN